MPVVTPKGTIQLPSLKTPRSSGRAVRYCIYEYDNLIDSSDIGQDDWIRMATDIEANYQFYDAFIILHGTDTMAYSVSKMYTGGKGRSRNVGVTRFGPTDALRWDTGQRPLLPA